MEDQKLKSTGSWTLHAQNKIRWIEKYYHHKNKQKSILVVVYMKLLGEESLQIDYNNQKRHE